MSTADVPCRAYIVYHHGLFAQGVRSVLETRRAVQIVGMENDAPKALKAVQSLRPDVVVVEASTGTQHPIRLGAFLHSAGIGRVVTLSLDHGFATVYQRNRVVAKDPADLIKVITGGGQQRIPMPGQADQTASLLIKSNEGAIGNSGSSGPTARVRRARTEEATKTRGIPRAPRARKGG